MRTRILLPALILAPSLLIVWFAFGSPDQDSSADREIRIGLGCKTGNRLAVERAALQYINGALVKYPNAKVIGVRWSESPLYYLHLDDEYDRRGIVYDRDRRSLWFYDGGGEGGWEGVSPTMIVRSVTTASPFMAFKTYGCKSRP